MTTSTPAARFPEANPRRTVGDCQMRLLLVEGSATVAEPLIEDLSRSSVLTAWHRDAGSAGEALKREVFDCVMVGAIHSASGTVLTLDLVQRVLPALPVIVIGPKWHAEQRTELFNAGADDVMEVPIDGRELVARLRAIMRRSLRRRSAPGVLVHGPLQVEQERRQVTWSGVAVALTQMEYRLLELLVRRSDHVFSRAELEDLLRGPCDESASNSLEVHVHHIRRKLHPGLVKTVRGRGYCIGPAEGPLALDGGAAGG